MLVFVFYLFNQPPMLFNRVTRDEIEAERARAASTARSKRSSPRPFEARRDALDVLAESA